MSAIHSTVRDKKNNRAWLTRSSAASVAALALVLGMSVGPAQAEEAAPAPVPAEQAQAPAEQPAPAEDAPAPAEQPAPEPAQQPAPAEADEPAKAPAEAQKAEEPAQAQKADESATKSTPSESTAPADPDLTATVTADALPTTQIDGSAYAQAVVGDRVFVGGDFKNARPAGAAPGENETPRANLLAYNIKTGELDPSFAPSTDGAVRGMTVSPDGSRLYVVGYFTKVNGNPRTRVAAFDTKTGALLNNFAPKVNHRVEGVAATNDTVYLAGEFSNVNNKVRNNVAALSASNGGLLPFSANVQGGWGARSVVISPDASKVVISGSFESVNGSTNPGRGMAALNAKTGASMPWAVNGLLHNASKGAAIYSLASDGDSVYGVGMDSSSDQARNGWEGAFRARWSDGGLVWMQDCHGDTYSIAPVGNSIYTAGHAHGCANSGGFPESNPRTFHHSLAFSKTPSGPKIAPNTFAKYRSFPGQQAPTLQHWFPRWTLGTFTGLSQATWNVIGNEDYVLYAGEFPAVNGTQQQGLVRFARHDLAPNKMGPQSQGGAWALSALPVKADGIKLTWNANTDPDNRTLSYEVRRKDKGATPLWTGTKDSTFWSKPEMTFTDATAVAGTKYEYQITVRDPDGNSTVSQWAPAQLSK